MYGGPGSPPAVRPRAAGDGDTPAPPDSALGVSAPRPERDSGSGRTTTPDPKAASWAAREREAKAAMQAHAEREAREMAAWDRGAYSMRVVRWRELPPPRPAGGGPARAPESALWGLSVAPAPALRTNAERGRVGPPPNGDGPEARAAAKSRATPDYWQTVRAHLAAGGSWEDIL